MNRPKYPSPAVDLTSYQLLIESVKDYAIFMLDPTGHIITWNIGAERIKGYTSEEIIGQHFSIFYPSADLQAGKPDMELQVAVKDGKYEEEGWRVRKDGSRFWASVVITALFGPEGELVGFAKVTRDLTERKRQEDALKQANATLEARVQEGASEWQALFAKSPIPTAQLDLTGRWMKVNQAFCAMTGYSADELMGMPYAMLTPSAEMANAQQNLQRLLAGEIESYSREREMIRKDGRRNVVEVSLSLVRNEQDSPKYYICVCNDITGRRQAEAARLKTEEIFRATFENAPLGICHVALDGSVLMANQALATMFGYSLAELYKLKPAKVIHPEDIPGDIEGAEKLLSGQINVFQREKRHIRKDGSICWTNVSSTLMRDEQGAPAYFIATVEDISERKQAEAELAEQRSLLELSNDAILVIEHDGTILYWNHGAEELYGYKREEALGQRSHDLLQTVFPQSLEAALDRLQQAGDWTGELIHTSKGGRQVTVLCRWALEKNTEGMPARILETNRDITDRKRGEEALRESEERYRATYEHAPVGIAQSSLTGHWQQVNERLCQILGYSREELLQMSFHEITHPDDLKVQVAYVDQLLTGKRDSFSMEKRYIRKDGSHVWTELTGSVIRHANGQPRYLIAVVEDITERKRIEDALRASEEQFRATFEQAAVGVVQVALDGHMIRVNQKLCEITGYRREELQKLSYQEITDPADHAADAALLQDLLHGKIQTGTIEKRYIRKNRTRVWVNLTISQVRDAAGKPQYFISVVEDITRRKQAEEAMRQAEAHFRLLVDGTDDYAIVRLDQYGQIASWNPGAEKTLGYQEEEIIGQHFSIFYTAEDVQRGEPQRKLSKAIRDGRAEDDRWYPRKDGSRFWGTGVINALYDEDGDVKGFVKIMRDMTEQRLHQEKATFLANHDTLTGLPNRAYFSDRLHEAIAHTQRDGRSVALLLLDLDRFKAVNDTLGHHIGDLLLKEVANRLQLCVRETDTVARLGGDEFVVIQTNVEKEADAAILAQKIVTALEAPYDLEGHEVHSGASVGVTIYARDAQDTVQLLKNADMALYRAKDSGRHNYQFYTQDMHARILGRQQMEQDLRRALANKEFSLYYQPQIDLHAWEVCGVEALLRWRNPQLQMLAPSDFLELAQETGLIVPIGEWVLREACWQNKAWQDAGIPFFRVGVNFSGRQIHDPKFLDMVKRVLAETGLSPSCLEIEINESHFIKDREGTEAILAELDALDIRISTDDFGAAISNLNLLCQFPMDTLKIDRRVIEHVAHRKQDRAMAAAVIGLATDLGVRVVAEGVETMEQLAFLQEKGCQAAQGFLFSPPVSARSLEVLLRAGNWSRMNPADAD